MHGPLHITAPVAQNTGKGKNTNSVTSGRSLSGEALPMLERGRGRRACSKETLSFLSFRGRLQKNTPKPLASILTPLF